MSWTALKVRHNAEHACEREGALLCFALLCVPFICVFIVGLPRFAVASVVSYELNKSRGLVPFFFVGGIR